MSDKVKTNDDCEEFEQDVDLDDTFDFPQVLTEHIVLGKHLIIAPENANWLVCDDDEYVAFGLFRGGKSIQEALSELRQLMGKRADGVVESFIAQVLGKEFLATSKVIDRPLFKMASLSLTAGCNLRCSICLLNATVAGDNECTFEHWKIFLQAFKAIGGEIASLTGGEPLLNSDCLRVAQYAKDVGLKVVLLTNGTLLSREKARILCGCCDQIRISVDGPDAETHEIIRGKGTFKKAIAGLRYLAEYPECQIGIAMTPTPATIPSFRNGLGNFARFVHKEIRSDIGIFVTGRLLPGRNTPKMSDEEKLIFAQAVHGLCNDQMGEGFVERMDATNIVPNRKNFSCGMAANIMVSADGGIYICNYSTETVGSIKDIREESGVQFLSRTIESLGKVVLLTGVDKFYPCADCDLKYFCGGKCRLEYTDDVCQCDRVFRSGWYESLVRINPYLFESLTGLQKGG